MASTALQDRAPLLPAAPQRRAPAGRGQLLALALPDPTSTADAVYAALERAARFGRPCPTNLALARRCGTTLAGVKGALTELARTGAIRVERVRAPTLRRIRIRASGQRTGEVR